MVTKWSEAMAHLFVFAEITPKTEYFDDAETALLNIVEKTRLETGCKAFSLFKGEAGTHLYLSEQWSDQAALDAHYAKDYTKAVFKSYEQWLSQPVAVTKMYRLA